ncbi:MAG: iron ABC transporter permease [Blautia sp.]|nr:iron ABC transporter permease [Blautia sp.]
MNKKILLPILVSAFSILCCLCIGPVRITPWQAVLALRRMLQAAGGSEKEVLQEVVLVQSRIPRTIIGYAVGCALASGGAVLQGLVHNQLADPYILGASYGAASSATFGLAAGWFASLGIYQTPVNGGLGAAAAMAFLFLYSLKGGRLDMERLLLGGAGISMFGRALVHLIIKMSPRAFVTGSTAFWTEGGLAGARLSYLWWVLLLLAACVLYLGIRYRDLNALQCGEETAGTLGVPVRYLQKVMILVISVLTGVSVAICGGIGFVGLVAPNLARLLVGGDYRKSLPVSAFLGGTVLIWCDAVARTVFAPVEISVGIVTAIIGGPLFLFFLKREM